MRLSGLLLVAGLALASGWRSRGRAKDAAEADGNYETVECKKCMTQVMRLLVPSTRGCASGNGTIVPSSVPHRVPTAFCDDLLPTKRQGVVYSFGVDTVWDFDSAMLAKGCSVASFDPFCCGAAHRVAPAHNFLPIGLATYDGMMESEDPKHPNITFPVMTLSTLMTSLEQPKVDVLRLKVHTAMEWKVLKNLINTGTIQDIRQLSLNLQMADISMWEEYRYVINGLRTAGFFPFYVSKQPDADYMKVQEGSQSLYNRYEASYGNANA